MKKHIWILILIGLLTAPLTAEKYQVEKSEDIQKTLSFQNPSQSKSLLVDNIFGSITVEGYSGTEVQLSVHKTIKARNQEALERAQQEVKLDITSESNAVEFYVDGPFRDQEGYRQDSSRRRNPGYQVHYDFEIKVPQRTDISLKTVTEGDIFVQNIEGDFEVSNVNGKVTIDEIAGAGSAHTVNGGVKVMFRRNPGEACSFKTVNGDLDVFFVDNLSADFRLKTFNGDMLTDFPVKYLPVTAGKAEKKNGKFKFNSSRFVGVQTGKGGPEMTMDTLNGDILIHKR